MYIFQNLFRRNLPEDKIIVQKKLPCFPVAEKVWVGAMKQYMKVKIRYPCERGRPWDYSSRFFKADWRFFMPNKSDLGFSGDWHRWRRSNKITRCGCRTFLRKWRRPQKWKQIKYYLHSFVVIWTFLEWFSCASWIFSHIKSWTKS